MTTRLSPWWRWEQGAPRQLTEAEMCAGDPLHAPEPVSPGAEVPTPRHVAYTKWPGGVAVSTVFLALDHQYCPGGPPILFETLVYFPDHALDQEIWRYVTRTEALAGHLAIVAVVRDELANHAGGDNDPRVS